MPPFFKAFKASTHSGKDDEIVPVPAPSSSCTYAPSAQSSNPCDPPITSTTDSTLPAASNNKTHDANDADKDSPITSLTASLSTTSLDSVNPWARADSIRTYRRHWNSFTGNENMERLRRGEMALCTWDGRDKAFEKLMSVANGGEEARDNGRREGGVWELYRDVDFGLQRGFGGGGDGGGGVVLRGGQGERGGEGKGGKGKWRQRVDSKDMATVGG